CSAVYVLLDGRPSRRVDHRDAHPAFPKHDAGLNSPSSFTVVHELSELSLGRVLPSTLEHDGAFFTPWQL
ncbi:hypothetical protein L0N32_11210, partial [Streptococcus gordonii]|uniref:hypothetical protein n=1 Tax=Streptococcus gordonii TaxID=1302 RepID=UPI001EDCC743